MRQLQKPEEARASGVEAFFTAEMKSAFYCADDDRKGRVLKCREPAPAGTAVWQQAASSFSTSPACGNDAYEALSRTCEKAKCSCVRQFFWAALCSLTTEQTANSPFRDSLATFTITPGRQLRLLLLRAVESSASSRHAKIISEAFRLRISPEILQKLANTWMTNCFETSKPQCYIIMWLPSFLNHSCIPNLRLAMGDGKHSFVALRDIDANEELTLSYLDDVDLLECISLRRHKILMGRGFECRCSLCVAVVDPTRSMSCDQTGDAKCEGDISCPGACINPPIYDAFAFAFGGSFMFSSHEWKGARCTKCRRAISTDEAVEMAASENMLWQLIQLGFTDAKIREIEKAHDVPFQQWLGGRFSSYHFLMECVRTQLCNLWRQPCPSPQNYRARKWSISLLTTLQERLDFALLYPIATALQAQLMLEISSELEREGQLEHSQVDCAIIEQLRARATVIQVNLHIDAPGITMQAPAEDTKENPGVGYSIVDRRLSHEWIKKIADVYGEHHIHLQDLVEDSSEGVFMIAESKSLVSDA